MNHYVDSAIQSVMDSEQSFCKFLSANDTGATGAHQSGILVSKAAGAMLFEERLENEYILKRSVRIRWTRELTTESKFTYYKSKNELRITCFGRGFPYLKPDRTGSLFVFTRQNLEEYSGFILDTDEDIEFFLDMFGLSPTETNNLIDGSRVVPENLEKIEMQKFIEQLHTDFPLSSQMSAAARNIYNKVYGHDNIVQSNPDRKIVEWTKVEYALFRAIEYARYGKIISRGFSSVDDFVAMANMVLNRRKSRAGKSLEHHLAAIFEENGILYTAQAVTEGNKKPDFLFPSQEAYHDPDFPADRLISLAAKTTCKDRWRQIITEADRLKDKPKFLCTLQQGISPAQMDEMKEADVVLVVPEPYIYAFPKDRRDRIWTISQFVKYVKEIEGIE